MVKKLLKHEFIAYKRTLLPMYAVLLGIAILTRIVFFFESDNAIFAILGFSSVLALCIACLVCFFMTYVIIVTRFYKNLFTNEGYLSFTLPVTTSQHILVKLLVGILSLIAALLSVFIAFCIATSGEPLVEIFKAVGYIVVKVNELLEGHFVWYLIEIAIATLAAQIYGILLFYGCIAIGQLTKKNSAIAAVGVYFAYYFATQMVSTFLMIAYSIFQSTDMFENVARFIENNPYETVHIAFLVAIVMNTLISTVFYFITRYIIKNKLNLE